MAARGSTEPAPEPVELHCTVAIDDPDVVEVLSTGDMEIHGRLPGSSNISLLATFSLGDRRAQGVVKPERGEQPLWDFPPGLWRREVATYRVADLLGWPIVPPTVPRVTDMGPGSVQYFVHADFTEHYFTLRDEAAAGGPSAELRLADLRHLCLLDVVANNADRKAGHCLVDEADRVWGIDHGLSFHTEPKLRTVIWDFAGDELNTVDREALAAVDTDILAATLAPLLDTDEIDACRARLTGLIASGRFPIDPTGRRIPWPLL